MTLSVIVGLACATVIFTYGTIFRPVRAKWPSFLGCALCVGFWIGLAGSIYFARHVTPFEHFFGACETSVLAMLLYLAIAKLNA